MLPRLCVFGLLHTSDITTDFVKATNRIYAKVGAILTNLQVVGNDVKLIREQFLKDARRPRPDTDTTKPQDQPQVPGRAHLTVKGGQSDGNENDGKDGRDSGFLRFVKRWKKSLRKPVIQLEIAALVGLAFYTCETRRTNNLTKRAIGDAQENFIKDQAPYIWTTPQQPKIVFNEPFKWDVHYSNYGRSPALNVRRCVRSAFGPKGFSFLPHMPPPSLDDKECSDAQRMPFASVSVDPPGFPGYSTSEAKDPFSQADIDAITNTEAGAYVWGIIGYDDASGHSYESVFCYFRFRSGAIADCPKYNYIKQTK